MFKLSYSEGRKHNPPRYYYTEDYNTLTNSQNEELRAYRIKLAGEGKKLKKPNGKKQFDGNSSNDRTSSNFISNKFKRSVSQAVAKEIK